MPASSLSSALISHAFICAKNSILLALESLTLIMKIALHQFIPNKIGCFLRTVNFKTL